MAACALFFNSSRQILIVKPSYREGWLMPGGVVERDESPAQACRREIREELGLERAPGRLLCLEYRVGSGASTESLQFIFEGGVLAEAEVQAIVLPPSELTACDFCAPDEALARLLPSLAARARFALAALDQGRTLYLENGSVLGN